MTIEVLKYWSTVTIAIYCAIQYVTPKYHTLHFKKQQEPIGTWRLLCNLLSAHGGSCGLFGCFGPHVEHCGQGLSIFLQKGAPKNLQRISDKPCRFPTCVHTTKKVRILFAPSLRHQLLSKASGIWHQLLPRQRSQAANQSHERNASKSIQMPCLHRSGFCVGVFVENGQGHENATAIHRYPQQKPSTRLITLLTFSTLSYAASDAWFTLRRKPDAEQTSFHPWSTRHLEKWNAHDVSCLHRKDWTSV